MSPMRLKLSLQSRFLLGHQTLHQQLFLRPTRPRLLLFFVSHRFLRLSPGFLSHQLRLLSRLRQSRRSARQRHQQHRLLHHLSR